MFKKHLFAFCVVLMFVAILGQVDEQPEDEEDPEDRGFFNNALLKGVLKTLGRHFAGAAGSCIEEAAHECKSEIFHPKKLIKCAGDFLKENKGRCLVD